MTTCGPNEIDTTDLTDVVSHRLRSTFALHYRFVWRFLRRLGLNDADADDGAQKVFLVFARRIDGVELGKERAFLSGTAVRVASHARRSRSRRREVGLSPAFDVPSRGDTIEQHADRPRARRLLGRVLSALPEDVRDVFVMFELHEMGSQEIAQATGIPVGTVASRLRRGRQRFQQIAASMRSVGSIA